MTVLHFVSDTVLTINARNYFGNLLFANYYTAVYPVVTVTNFTWYSSIYCNSPPPPTGIEYLSLSALCAFQTLTPLLKFHKYSPAFHLRQNEGISPRTDGTKRVLAARRGLLVNRTNVRKQIGQTDGQTLVK